MSMIGLVQTAWLFTRGPQSVRIVRIARVDGSARLLVQGPGPAQSSYESADTIDCMRYQAQIEQRLVAEGFQLENFMSAERRAGLDRRASTRGADRRRALELLV